MAPKWLRVDASDVPMGLRWDVPAEHAGQTVEISYGGPSHKLSLHDNPPASDPRIGARWKRESDRSDGEVVHYRLNPAWVDETMRALEERTKRKGGRSRAYPGGNQMRNTPRSQQRTDGRWTVVYRSEHGWCNMGSSDTVYATPLKAADDAPRDWIAGPRSIDSLVDHARNM